MNRKGNINVHIHIKVISETGIMILKNSLLSISQFSQRYYMLLLDQIMMTGIGQHKRGNVQLQLHHQPEDHLEQYLLELIVPETDFH